MPVRVEASISRPKRPSFEDAYAWQQEGNFHRAAAEYARFLKLHPNQPSALNNLGNCLRSMGRDGDAVRCFERALELDPGRDSSRLNLALARLALDEYKAAWPDYEKRLETIVHRRELLAYRNQQWRGENLSRDRTLYLFGNQGLGDELQCLRFLPEVARRVARVVLEVQKPMLPLVAALPENVKVIGRGEKIPPFQHWCEIFSLPGIFGVERTNIPRPVRPVFAKDPEIESVIARSRRAHPDDFHVGLVWSGNPQNDLNRFRACGLEHMLPLLDIPETKFFSLQMGVPSTELASIPEAEMVEDLSPLLKDFASTATAIESLDLVITVDTSVAHLAGTLEVESWVCLHNPADWRWGREGETAPWYPSLRLFRQERMRDWKPVIAKVREALRSAVIESRFG